MACNGNTDLTEERAVEEFLRCMPKKYAQIVMSIETLLNFEQLIIKDVIGRLKAVHDREEGPHAKPGTAGGKLLYMMEQWRTFEKEEGSEPSGSSKERRDDPAAARKRRRGPKARQALMAAPLASARRPGMTPATTAVGPATGPRTAAFLYAAVGRLTSHKQGEDAAALFLVHGCVELQQEAREGVKGPSFPLSMSAGSVHLHLDEVRAHTFLGKGANDDKIDGWYLDIGATHHMTGRREFFSNLPA
jgi:hypothetical protein